MRQHDQAVSPVIAVILMVAITVLLSTVVYFFVSGFGGENATPRTIGLTSSGPADEWNASYTVTSASPTLAWEEMAFQVGGSVLEYANLSAVFSPGSWCVMEKTYCLAAPEGFAAAGTRIMLQTESIGGKKLNVIDVPANAVILTLNVR